MGCYVESWKNAESSTDDEGLGWEDSKTLKTITGALDTLN